VKADHVSHSTSKELIMTQRIAIVTGASSGIGLAITQGLLHAGYGVVALARKATQSQALTETESLLTVDGDVGTPDTAKRTVDLALKRFDRVDLLVNNAGFFLSKPFVDYSAQEAQQLVSTNLLGFVHMTQATLPYLVSGGQGHVVSMTSSLTVQPIFSVPSALPILIKGGLETATRSLSIEYAERGVRFNAVAPGIIDTPMHAPESHEFLKRLSPASRLGAPQEVFAAVHFLDQATFISGEVLHLDGGAHAGKWS
jgi:NAD(P)-dependent dehydrogenase (short-subunit alcohol dehydrogenase family)